MAESPREKGSLQSEAVLGTEEEKSKDNLADGSNETQIIPTGDTKAIENGVASASDPDTADSHETTQSPNKEPPSERPIESVPSSEDYSVLTPTQKKLVIVTVSFASVFSPMATAIYCKVDFLDVVEMLLTLKSLDPSLTTIAKDLHVSDSQINITVTLFLVLIFLPVKPCCILMCSY